jgi:hypothetical protein
MVLHCAVSVSALYEVYSIQPCDNVASDNVVSDFRQIVWISTVTIVSTTDQWTRPPRYS